jgi:hypothetical protein
MVYVDVSSCRLSHRQLNLSTLTVDSKTEFLFASNGHAGITNTGVD